MSCALAINLELDLLCLMMLLEYSKILNMAISCISGFLCLCWKQKIIVFPKSGLLEVYGRNEKNRISRFTKEIKGRRLKSHWMVSQVLFQFFLIFGRLPILSSIREICLLPYEKFISLSSWLYFLSYQHFVSTLGKQLGINHIPLSYICILHSCLIPYCVLSCHWIFAYHWKSRNKTGYCHQFLYIFTEILFLLWLRLRLLHLWILLSSNRRLNSTEGSLFLPRTPLISLNDEL